MIDLTEINGEIEKLEGQPLSYQTIERLSWLYTVRDHAAKPAVGCFGDSPCMTACAGKPLDQVMSVVDELMDTLLILHPRLYDAVMNRLV